MHDFKVTQGINTRASYTGSPENNGNNASPILYDIKQCQMCFQQIVLGTNHSWKWGKYETCAFLHRFQILYIYSAGSRGGSRALLEPQSPSPVFKYPMVSVRPNYFIFIEYLRKMG